MNLDLINGNEIIDFLNTIKWRDHDTMLYSNSFVFESQEIKDSNWGKKYVLNFSTYWNNWGSDQEVGDNSINIFEDGTITVDFDEPLDGDGSSDAVEEILKSWLPTHTFNQTSEKDFLSLIHEAENELSNMLFTSAKNHPINSTIEKLIKARTFLKQSI